MQLCVMFSGNARTLKEVNEYKMEPPVIPDAVSEKQEAPLDLVVIPEYETEDEVAEEVVMTPTLKKVADAGQLPPPPKMAAKVSVLLIYCRLLNFLISLDLL